MASCGLPDALTGPISRGDAATVAEHLLVMNEKCSDFVPLYKDLGRQALQIAAEKGKMDQRGALQLAEMLKKDE